MRAWRDRRCEAVVQHPPLRRSACKRSGTQRPGRDHPPGSSRQSGASRCGHQRTSKSPAAPMPPPTHIVTTTCLTPRRRALDQRVAGEAGARHAIGMADGDRAAVDVQSVVGDAEAIAAVEHLHGERLVELPQSDVVDREAEPVRGAWARRTPVRCPSRRARILSTVKPRNRPSGSMPRRSASLASMTTQAAAPSESWLALPAVTQPPSMTGRRPARASAVVSGRLHSSRSSVTRRGAWAPSLGRRPACRS